MSQGIAVTFRKHLEDVEMDVSFVAPSHGITAIFGRSGAGKTSIVNAVSGLLSPDSGEIVVNGRTLFDSKQGTNIAVEKRNLGYVFQEPRLFPHYTVEGNLRYGIKEKDEDYFNSIVELLSLEQMLTRYPKALSGGEKQRVAIGRALLSKPDLLLMDEPLASLDLPRKREVMPFLEMLSKQVKIPIFYVSHSLSEILRLADHLIVVDQGKVVSDGKIEDVWSSKVMRPWQSFSEQSTLFSATVSQHNLEYGLTQLQFVQGLTFWVQQVDADVGSTVRLQIRANDVSIALNKNEQSSIRNILPARIASIEYQQYGDNKKSVAVKLDLKQDCYLWATITKWALDDLKLQEGMEVFAQIKGVSVSQRDIAITHL
ncbi:molybdenum ABC transporter ATP-binding protein ModC [Vibrio diazotrophicus]|uniref:molybdenum ABC transporter ATP-binding protein ModC n=1 Tax=Vibrio diazotrophicus TaxID=685 RepID=UPI00142D5436|nr:molybdenum ABC transporter ATP-binding protein ModC [Vibrio diazotrophicus]NIY91808.1 molybdenum ABC transporter ATP-binding protein ModC [Vibrio diazotrophicus]